MQTKTRNFYILFGPTGSGKSTVFSAYAHSKYNTRSDINSSFLKKHHIFFGSVDMYVEKDRDYLRRIAELNPRIQRLNRRISRKGTKKHQKEILDSSRDTIESISREMTDIYFDVRNTKNYNNVNDKNIMTHMRKGYDILFEITGTNPDTIQKICDQTLFLSKDASLADYNIVVLFPFVHFPLLKYRILERFLSQVKNGMSARLPPVDDKTLTTNEKLAFDNLVHMIVNRCASKVIIYDNNDKLTKSIDLTIDDLHSACFSSKRLKFETESTDFNEFIRNNCRMINRRRRSSIRRKSAGRRPSIRKKSAGSSRVRRSTKKKNHKFSF